MDYLDREIINQLQSGFPISDQPFEEVARQLDTSESEVMTRIRCMLDDGMLTRFGPLFNIDRMGGVFTLCAMHVDEDEFDDIAEIVNQFPEVAHNYQRDHHLNMWFVLAAESQKALQQVIDTIEQTTAYTVLNFPKQREYYVNLQLSV